MTAPTTGEEIVGATAITELDDPALVALLRAGGHDAHVALRERHSPAARRLASVLGMLDDTEEILAEAFAYTFEQVLGADDSDRTFREVLFTTIRHESRRQAELRHHKGPENDLSFFERSPVDAAYDSLPPRWRSVLWHLDVEGQKPSALGAELGLSAVEVSALVYRARSALRQAYLHQHVRRVAPIGGRSCRDTRRRLAALVRRDVPEREQEQVHAHLHICEGCMSDYLRMGGHDVGVGGSTPTR